jgi:apolipoprotein D and lipocalin family protein
MTIDWRRNFMRVHRQCLSFVFLCACVLSLASCANAPPNPNPHASDPLPLANFDLSRYMGRWYNIAHIPYIGENGYVASYSEWTLRSDGQIDDLFAGKKNSFTADETRRTFVDTVEPGTGNAHWHVHLLGPITVSQLTLYVDPEYRYTLLGYPDKSLGWVFARTPDIDPKTYADLIARLDAMGYDTSRLGRVPQKPEDLGKPGYLTP